MMGLLSLDRSALLVVAAVFGMYQFVEGGCSGRCCQGTDFTCATTDWRMDRVCGLFLAQPCVVSEWSHWSGCAQPCQPSFRVRRRSVERLPQNSGQACPRLEEQAGCMEYQDRQGEFCASYTRWMQYLREGYTVCVACQPPAMNNHSQSCQGDGNLAPPDGRFFLSWQG